ncbi:hypothetical protein C2U69_25445 [Cupriavidus pinatubonensis]|nr:hypothetical protein C2U69_25445 [Cupriavidus pinatubonensis]
MRSVKAIPLSFRSPEGKTVTLGIGSNLPWYCRRQALSTALKTSLRCFKKKPGAVSIGTPGNNNVNHTFAAMLARAANVDFVNVPYTGGSKVLTDLAGNQIDAGVLKPLEACERCEQNPEGRAAADETPA